MTHLIRATTLATLTVAAIFVAAPTAQAGHDHPVKCAAERYREAVCDFERLVLKTRYIERCDERLVDDLEDSTARLRSAAHHLDRLDRLFCAFDETDRLHGRVQRVFFTHSVYPPNYQLERCWHHVNRAYQRLVYELRCLRNRGHHHHHGDDRYRNRPPRPNPNSFYRSQYTPTFRPETLGARPALSPRAARPAAAIAQDSLRDRNRSDDRRRSFGPTRRPVPSGNDLRAALIGAALQRLVN